MGAERKQPNNIRSQSASKAGEGEMSRVSTYYVRMNAYCAVVFVENIQTNELCHYVGEGSDAGGNVKLSEKKHVSHRGTSHGKETLLTRAVHRH